MGCEYCSNSLFRKKLGRCKRCMWQLAILNILGWSCWWFFFSATPQTVNAIALLMFCLAFAALLTLHVIVWGWRAWQQTR